MVTRRGDPEGNPLGPRRGDRIGTQKTEAGRGDQKRKSKGKSIPEDQKGDQEPR